MDHEGNEQGRKGGTRMSWRMGQTDDDWPALGEGEGEGGRSNKWIMRERNEEGRRNEDEWANDGWA